MANVDAQAIADQFQRDGIVLLPAFFDTGLMEQLAGEMDAEIAAAPSPKIGGGTDYARERDTRVYVWPGKGLSVMTRVFEDPRLHAISALICGHDYIVGGQSIFSTREGGGQAWHQDSRDTRPGHFELNRIVFPRNTQPAQGGLVYVPGSYVTGDLPRGGNHDPLPGQQQVLPTAGTLVLMHTRCFHRVELNTTQTPRTQCNSRIRPSIAPDGLGNTPMFRSGPWTFSTNKAE